MTKAEKLDRKSYPLRKAVEEQARRFGCGFTSGWVEGRKSWIYNLTGRLTGVEVVVLEDASNVFFVSTNNLAKDRIAKTPRGVAAAFNWLVAMHSKEKTDGTAG